MAVKIIKIKPAKKVVKRKICRNCGATLEYTPRDVLRYDGIDIAGGPDGREYIICPNCREDITLRSW